MPSLWRRSIRKCHLEEIKMHIVKLNDDEYVNLAGAAIVRFDKNAKSAEIIPYQGNIVSVVDGPEVDALREACEALAFEASMSLADGLPDLDDDDLIDKAVNSAFFDGEDEDIDE